MLEEKPIPVDSSSDGRLATRTVGEHERFTRHAEVVAESADESTREGRPPESFVVEGIPREFKAVDGRLQLGEASRNGAVRRCSGREIEEGIEGDDRPIARRPTSTIERDEARALAKCAEGILNIQVGPTIW